MQLMAFLVGGVAGTLVGALLAFVLSRLAPKPPQRRPTVLGWACLVVGVAAAGALVLGFASGALTGPLVPPPRDAAVLVDYPPAWSAALAGAALSLGFSGAGRVADRHWPTGTGLVVAGGVVLAWLMLLLSRLGELLLARQ